MIAAVLTALWSPLALAARPPDEGRALRTVEALQAQARRAREGEGSAVAGLVAPSAYGELHAARLVERLGSDLDGPLGAALADGELAGFVRGPDYLRAVFAGSPALTLTVRREGGAAVVDELAWSACGLCGEPERFVRDLLADVEAERDAAHRLLPGVELHVDSWLDGQRVDPVAWRRALVRRNSHAGYLRFVLDGATVAGADGGQVRVELADRTETWPVAWVDGRWQIVYERLPADSPLRLDPADVRSWAYDSTVASASVAWWLTDGRSLAGGQLVARDVVALLPRATRGDVVVYGQDLGRTWGLLARLDAETGEVLFRGEVPTLSERVNVHPWLWRRSFRVALSPDEQLLAVAVHDRLWVLGVEEGEVQLSRRTQGEVSALVWHGGALLAAHAGSVTRFEADGFSQGAQRWVDGETAGLAVTDGVLWRVSKGGEVRPLEPDTLADLDVTRTVCCGNARAATVEPSSASLCVTCGADCEPAWLWRDDGGEGALLADAARHAEDGVVSFDPSGLWHVVPWSGDGGRAALIDARTDEVVAVFAPNALLSAAWAPDGSALWAVDTAGHGWRWSTLELAARGP